MFLPQDFEDMNLLEVTLSTCCFLETVFANFTEEALAFFYQFEIR